MSAPVQARPDHGTNELRKKHLTIEVPTEAAGITAAQVLEECLLDSLYRRGRLRFKREAGPPKDDEARRRYNAGLWLRRVYSRAGIRERETMAYTVFGQAGSGPHPTGCLCEECQRTGWNWKCYLETMRAMSSRAYILRAVCCLDSIPGPRYGDLRLALDGLADFRQM